MQGVIDDDVVASASRLEFNLGNHPGAPCYDRGASGGRDVEAVVLAAPTGDWIDPRSQP